MSSSQGPCLNDAVCEYKNSLLLETWTQPLERANPYYSLVPGSSGMRFVQCVINRAGREVSTRLCHALWEPGHCFWVGMKPQEICPPIRAQASYIPVTNVCVEGGGCPYWLTSALWGVPNKAAWAPGAAPNIWVEPLHCCTSAPSWATRLGCPNTHWNTPHRNSDALARKRCSKWNSDVGLLPQPKTAQRKQNSLSCALLHGSDLLKA